MVITIISAWGAWQAVWDNRTLSAPKLIPGMSQRGIVVENQGKGTARITVADIYVDGGLLGSLADEKVRRDVARSLDITKSEIGFVMVPIDFGPKSFLTVVALRRQNLPRLEQVRARVSLAFCYCSEFGDCTEMVSPALRGRVQPCAVEPQGLLTSPALS